MTNWMKTNAPHIIASKAQIYAAKFYDNECMNMTDVASKIAGKKTFALEIGVERDDNDDIISGLLKPLDNTSALLAGPNVLGKYTLVNPKTSSNLTNSVEEKVVHKANK